MRILLHSCCAPCTCFPLAVLRSQGHLVDVIFVNPNIDPPAEQHKRWETLRLFGEREGFSVRRVDIAHEKWLASLPGDLAKPGRCRACYKIRLECVASLAQKQGYDCFTTTLLVSPYQDHSGIIDAGLEASQANGAPFLYMDFRVGYRRSREMARARGMYMQKYCGCEFSLEEPSS